MSEYEAVVKAVDTIMSFLYTHEKSSTTSMWESDIDGTTLKTDWGYFEQGLNEIKWYCTELESNVIPSADRPQGEWILLEPRYPIEQKVYWNKEQALADTKGNGAIERRKCSCCGYAKSFMCHMKDEQIKLWNFCPNCGCRMKGADDE